MRRVWLMLTSLTVLVAPSLALGRDLSAKPVHATVLPAMLVISVPDYWSMTDSIVFFALALAAGSLMIRFKLLRTIF